MKTSNDPLEILDSVTRQSCNAMHMLCGLMEQVREMRSKHCYDKDTCPNGELTSARSPECLDEILDKLIFIMRCEANCGVGQVITVNGQTTADICEFDKDGQPKP